MSDFHNGLRNGILLGLLMWAAIAVVLFVVFS
jgi:hypothetical protein